MTEAKRYTGGCLCGALRYETAGEPRFTGHCYCVDCQKASGSGFMPFMSFAASAVRITGEVSQFVSKALSGGDATRNRCAACGSLVFGGELGKSDMLNIYAGTLDDPSSFRPRIAIFARSRPPWAAIPPELKVFDALPTRDRSRQS